MRPVRTITAEEERFRIEPVEGTDGGLVRRDPIQPEPIGTIVLKAFCITGYEQDCDGSLMARLENIDRNGEYAGWREHGVGLDPSSSLVASQREWEELFRSNKSESVKP